MSDILVDCASDGSISPVTDRLQNGELVTYSGEKTKGSDLLVGRRSKSRGAAAAFATAVAAIAASSSWAQTSRPAASEAKRLERLQKLDADHFARTAKLIDDDLETVAQINTSPGFAYRGGFTERVRSDNFLRASISKSDGKTLFQVYQTLLYTGGHRNFVSANYQTSTGPRSVPLIRISSNVSSCASAGFCLRAEDVAFEVPEEVLRSIASGAGQPWRYRLNAQAGESWDDNLSPSEVAGLLSRVDAYRAARK